MTTSESRIQARPCTTRHLPQSLNSNAGAARSMAQAVEAAARAVDQTTLMPVARHDGGLAFQPKVLLTLLSACYAHKTYSSAKVAALLRGDATLRQFCGNEVPDARMIRRFRSENREPLHRCLQSALRYLADQKVAEGLVTRVNEAQLSEEASRRIIMAMFTDSMELDRDQTPHSPVDLCYLFASRGPTTH